MTDTMNKMAEEKKTGFNATVNPIIAWSAYGGTLALAIALALIFWL